MFVSEEGSPRVEQMKARDELYKIRSSRKTDSLLANRSSGGWSIKIGLKLRPILC